MIKNTDKNVLVGVLKDKRDLTILLRKGWYRIPLAHALMRPGGSSSTLLFISWPGLVPGKSVFCIMPAF